MSRSSIFAIAALWTLGIGTTPSSAAPLEIYGQLPNLDNVAISPDGSQLAYEHNNGDEKVIMIRAASDYKAAKVQVGNQKATISSVTLVAGIRIGNNKLRSLQWADNQHLLLTTSTTERAGGIEGPRREWFQMQIYDVPAHRMRAVELDVPNMQTLNTIIGNTMVRLSDNKASVFVKGYYFPSGSPTSQRGLFKVDVASGQANIVGMGKEGGQDWLVDDTGAVVAEQDYMDASGKWSLRVAQDGRLTEVATGHQANEPPQIIGLTQDGSAAIVQMIEDGDPVWKPLSLKDGSWGPALEPGHIPSGVIEDPTTGRPVGEIYLDSNIRYQFFDPKLQARWDSIVHAFGGDKVALISRSADFHKIVVLVDGPEYGFSYHLVDLDAKRADPIGDVYEGLKDFAEVRPIHYAAADGKEIPAYLTLPHGVPAHNLPLIVLPHGGPQARDEGSFDWWAQALSAQGYAVLQPNYRGSALGWKFVSSGFGEWGRKMQTDLSDGVRHLAAEGIIDPTRVCIVGASYGGYAALAGITLDPGIYRCAVSVSGISDPKRFLSWTEQTKTHQTERYLDRFLGIIGGNEAKLDDISPITHIKTVTVPVMLIHGRDDTVVPFAQSDDMADALAAAGKPVEFVTLDHEDHWLSRGTTRLQMLQASVAFLKKNNPTDEITGKRD